MTCLMPGCAGRRLPRRPEGGVAAGVVALPDPQLMHQRLVVVADQPAQLTVDSSQHAGLRGREHDQTIGQWRPWPVTGCWYDEAMTSNPIRCGAVLPGGTATEQLDMGVLAEQSGWDGVFTWEAAYGVDPWNVLAALAARTSRIRLGTMLTPLPWRRPRPTQTCRTPRRRPACAPGPRCWTTASTSSAPSGRAGVVPCGSA